MNIYNDILDIDIDVSMDASTNVFCNNCPYMLEPMKKISVTRILQVKIYFFFFFYSVLHIKITISFFGICIQRFKFLNEHDCKFLGMNSKKKMVKKKFE